MKKSKRRILKFLRDAALKILLSPKRPEGFSPKNILTNFRFPPKQEKTISCFAPKEITRKTGKFLIKQKAINALFAERGLKRKEPLKRVIFFPWERAFQS